VPTIQVVVSGGGIWLIAQGNADHLETERMREDGVTGLMVGSCRARVRLVGTSCSSSRAHTLTERNQVDPLPERLPGLLRGPLRRSPCARPFPSPVPLAEDGQALDWDAS
jgi:hypothetical protein